MKLAIFLSFVFLAIPYVSFAQADEAVKAGENESFADFDLNLAPNTSGALEGSVRLDIFWSPWLGTRSVFSVSSFTSVYPDFSGSTTSIESNKSLDLEIVRTRDGFLRLDFAPGDFFAALNLSLLVNGAILNQEKYGYGKVPLAFTFFSTQNMILLYPFAHCELELGIGMLSIEGYFRQSIAQLWTKVDGEFYFSMIGSSVAFSTEDRGSETRFGGSASLKPVSSLEIEYSFDYRRHTGYTYAYIVGAGPQEFNYEASEMKHTGSVSFEIAGYRPLVGVSFVTYGFAPLSLAGIASYTSSRWSFIVGIVRR